MSAGRWCYLYTVFLHCYVAVVAWWSVLRSCNAEAARLSPVASGRALGVKKAGAKITKSPFSVVRLKQAKVRSDDSSESFLLSGEGSA